MSPELAVVELSTVRKATYIHVISTHYSDVTFQLNVMKREVGDLAPQPANHSTTDNSLWVRHWPAMGIPLTKFVRDSTLT